jgi:hypothetical protein
MNNEHLMLALIVPSTQMKRMDVYLQPYTDEFKQLWEGIHIYYVSIPIPLERYFMLYVICAYTKHDYPILGVFSGKHVH